MGFLVGLGDDVDVLVGEIAALVREAVLRPRLQDDLQLLEHAVAALAVRHAEALVGGGKPAASDAELEATVADVVHGGRLLGRAQGVGQGQHMHGRADLQAFGARGERGGDDEGGGQHGARGTEVDLGQPDRVEPVLLGGRGLGERLVEGLGLATARGAGTLVKDAELHGQPPRRRSPALFGGLCALTRGGVKVPPY
jgi:hypothetical protein